jgi:hypothetical protein
MTICPECMVDGGHKMDCSNRPIKVVLPGTIQWTAGTVMPPMPTPPPNVEVPLVAGSVIGLRAWRLDDFGELLAYAQKAAPPWRPGENESVCLASGLSGPMDQWPCSPDCVTCRDAIALRTNGHTFDARCTCGFYGVFRPGHIPTRNSPEYVVVGVIEAYGRTVIGPGGFRASKAKVLALTGPPGAAYPASIFGRLSERWGSVPFLPSLAHAVAEFPITDPKDYL